jgi:hypothetical protein
LNFAKVGVPSILPTPAAPVSVDTCALPSSARLRRYWVLSVTSSRPWLGEVVRENACANDAAAPAPSAEPPIALPARVLRMQPLLVEVCVGVGEDVAVKDGVGVGVPEEDAPGEGVGVGEVEGDAVGHTNRRTTCPS